MGLVLVTGGAGFIGSHLVRRLLLEGEEVRVLDNFSSGKRAYIDGCNIEIIEGDLRDGDCVTQSVQGVETIYHHAAFISVPLSMQEPQTCFDVNVMGTINLFEAARKAGVNRVVIASSSAVYGDSQNLPLRESEPLLPLSPYGVSKQVTELYANLYWRVFGLPIVALRYFNVYGPRQAPDSPYAAVVPRFIRRLLDGQDPIVYGDGAQKRDFVYVEDVVQANILAAKSSHAVGLAINVCSGKEISILDVLKVMYDVFSKFSGTILSPHFDAAREGDIIRSVGNPSLAEQILGFKAQVQLEEGVFNTVTAFRKVKN